MPGRAGGCLCGRGDRGLALEAWRDAMTREERLERVRVAARIRAKIEGPGTNRPSTRSPRR